MDFVRGLLRGHPRVTLFTTPGCPDCAAVKRFLEQRGVPFRERDMSRDPRAAEDMKRLAGVRIAPVTVVGDRAFYGTFDRQLPHLREALAAFAPDPEPDTAPDTEPNPERTP